MSFRAHLIIYIFAINMSKETMKNGKIIDHAGRFALVDTGVGTYAVGMSSRFGAHDISSFFDLGGRSWDKDPQSVGVRLGSGHTSRQSALGIHFSEWIQGLPMRTLVWCATCWRRTTSVRASWPVSRD